MYGRTEGDGSSSGARPTVYTFLPAVMGMGGGTQQQLQHLSGGATHHSGDGAASPFLRAGGGGGFSGNAPPGIGRPSPVMNAGK